jgi:ribulose bisphosphate carboxylase small subunit
MHADLMGALEQINKAYKAFEHRGQRMSKEQVRKVLKYGLLKGYKTTAEFTDKEVDEILNK